jgi:hypothetical protein
LRNYLEKSTDADQPWPPEDETNGVYVVSKRPWTGAPSRDDDILYVGGNRDKSSCFFDRVSNLIADMLGLFGGNVYRHSGGQWLWHYCREKGIKPLDLYLGWAVGIPCRRCGEAEVYKKLQPERRKKSPPSCAEHLPPLRACFRGVSRHQANKRK